MKAESTYNIFRLLYLAVLFTAQVSCAHHGGHDQQEEDSVSRRSARSPQNWKEQLDEDSDLSSDHDESRGKEKKNIRRVYGGEAANLGDFKAVVFLNLMHSYTEEGMTFDGPSSNCTGAIVSPKWVMTASHCLPAPYLYTFCYPKQDGRYSSIDVWITVTAGSVDLLAASQATAVTLSVASPAVNQVDIFVHEDAVWFKKGNIERPRFYYDIALLRVQGAFPMNDAIGSTALLSGPMPVMFPGRCTALGFGKQAERSNVQGLPVVDGKLRYNLVRVGGNEFCEKITKVKKWTDKQFICASNDADRRKMTCVGDSGSPLLCGPSEDKVVAGVLSGSLKGGDCGEEALDDDYTFTGLVEDWVKNVTNKEVTFSPLPVRSHDTSMRKTLTKARSGQQGVAPTTIGVVLATLLRIALGLNIPGFCF